MAENLYEAVKEQIGVDLKTFAYDDLERVMIHPTCLNHMFPYYGLMRETKVGGIHVDGFMKETYRHFISFMPCVTYNGVDYHISGIDPDVPSWHHFMEIIGVEDCWFYTGNSADIGDGVVVYGGFVDFDYDVFIQYPRAVICKERVPGGNSLYRFIQPQKSTNPLVFNFVHGYRFVGDISIVSLFEQTDDNDWDNDIDLTSEEDQIHVGVVPLVYSNMYLDDDETISVDHIVYNIQGHNYNVDFNTIKGHEYIGEVKYTDKVFGVQLPKPVRGFVPTERYKCVMEDTGMVYEIDDDGFLLWAKYLQRVYSPFNLTPYLCKEMDDAIIAMDRYVGDKSGINTSGGIHDNSVSERVANILYNKERTALSCSTREIEIQNNTIKRNAGSLKELNDRIASLSKHSSMTEQELDEYVNNVISSVQKIDKVEKIGMHSDQLVVILKPLVATASSDNTSFKFQLGKILVRINFSDYELQFCGIPDKTTGRIHPHIGHDPCYGSIMSNAIRDAFKEFDLPTIVMLAIQFLEQANLSDEWGRYANDFPKVES